MNIKSYIFSVTVILAGTQIGTSQSTANANSDFELLKVNNKSVSASEFKYVYNKNNNVGAYTDKSVRDYMQMYIKFRLKVTEAEVQGRDTTKAFIEELKGYRKQLAQPYLTEKSVTENLIKEAYDRMMEEVNASHILIRVSPDADPADSLAAYNKILDIRKKATAGQDFQQLARTYSEDPSAQANGGNLGYFTALQMIYPFETMAYSTQIGQISPVFRTKFGYHILKTEGRRKSQGEIRSAHIMVKYTAGTNPDDSITAINKINEIYKKLKQEADWNTVCNDFSDDLSSKAKGGELPTFSTGQMLPSFEEACFKLQYPTQISEPFQTPYGFHIVKLLEKKPMPSYKELESALRSKVGKDSRSELSKSFFIARLKRDYKFTEKSKAIKYALSLADTNLFYKKWTYSPSAKNLDNPIFTLINKTFTVRQFLDYAKANQKVRTKTTPAYYMNMLYKDFVNESLTQYEEANLDKYEEYRMLVKEYRDGILLFQLMENKVWTKAIEDTTGLKTYFETNKQKYMWKERAECTIYNCKNDFVANTLKAMLAEKYFEVDYEKIGRLTFEKGKSTPKPAEQKILDEMVNIMGRDKNYFIELSSSGELNELPKSKKSLSKDRLTAITKYLTSKGIDSTRIIKINLGDKKPSPNSTVENKFVNYRIVSKSNTVLQKMFNDKGALSIQIKQGKIQRGDEPILDSVPWKPGTQTVQKNERTYIIVIDNVLPPNPKSFEEARGQVISDYQAQLEEDWVNELRQKYPVVINEENLKKIIK
ncbi:MAG: peptidylprolyl isomerase [Cytophagales bacterium]|nr:peptidylprolyl isomerase [Cytophagales bacterium]